MCDYSVLQYITRLMEWAEKQINNEDIFPVEVGEFIIVPLIAVLPCVVIYYCL